MGIPEHDKCVALHKQLRKEHQVGNWHRVRAIRRKKGDIKLKMRIRQMLKIEFQMQKSRIKKQYGMSYTEFMRTIRRYRRWGKYDD